MKNRKLFAPFKNAFVKLKKIITMDRIPKIKVGISQSLNIDIYKRSMNQYKSIDFIIFNDDFCFASSEGRVFFMWNIKSDKKNAGTHNATIPKITHIQA